MCHARAVAGCMPARSCDLLLLFRRHHHHLHRLPKFETIFRPSFTRSFTNTSTMASTTGEEPEWSAVKVRQTYIEYVMWNSCSIDLPLHEQIPKHARVHFIAADECCYGKTSLSC